MNYLVLDTETGGLSTEASLLTLHFGVYDKELTLLDELSVKLKAQSLYNVTAEALRINKIDIVAHDKEAISVEEAKVQIYNFLNVHSDKEKTPLILCGHNVGFDVKFVVGPFLSEKLWNRFVARRTLDTTSVARFLQLQGKLPPELGSLESLAKHFGLSTEKLHDSKEDVRTTVEVLKKLRGL